MMYIFRKFYWNKFILVCNSYLIFILQLKEKPERWVLSWRGNGVLVREWRLWMTFFVCGRVGGRMAGWPDGRMAGWPGGRMAGWPDVRVAGWPGWPGGRVAGWPGGRMAGWPDGRVAGFRQSLITAIFQQSFAQSFKTGIMSAMFPRGFRKVSARFGCWNVQFASMLSSYFAKNFPIRKTRRGPNREVAGNFAEDFKAQRYAPSGLPMVFPTTYPAKAICLAKEVKMSLRTKLP